MKTAPLSSRDACDVLDGLDDGVPLEKLVCEDLVKPITEWLDEVRRIEVERFTAVR